MDRIVGRLSAARKLLFEFGYLMNRICDMVVKIESDGESLEASMKIWNY